jgi:hypothetical protein
LLVRLLITSGLIAAGSSALGQTHQHGSMPAGPAGDGQYNPFITADGRGGFYLVYVQRTTKVSNVMLRHSTNGVDFSAPVRVNDRDGDATVRDENPPKVAVSPQGDIYVCWGNEREQWKGNVRFARSTDGGKTFSPAVNINSDAMNDPAGHAFQSIAVDKQGRIYIAWIDERNKTREDRGAEIWMSVSEDRGQSFTSNRRILSDVCECCRTNLQFDGAGNLYLSYRIVPRLGVMYRDIILAKSEDGGTTFKTTVVSHDGWEVNGCPVAGPGLSVDEAGKITVVWFMGGGGRPGLYYATSADRGKTFAPRQMLDPQQKMGKHAHTALRPNGDVIVVWDDSTDKPLTAWGILDKASGRLLKGGERIGVNFPTVAINDGTAVIAGMQSGTGELAVFPLPKDSEKGGAPTTESAAPYRQSGKYQVTLRLPEDGLVAGEEQQIEFRLVDTSRTDPVLGPAAVIRAVIQSTVVMPSMPSMPKVEEIAHPEGVPGDYGLHPTFAHGGDYVLGFRIAPPAGQPFTMEFPLKVADEIPNHKPRIRPYKIELRAEQGKVKSGDTAKLRFLVWANRETRDAEGRPTGKRQFEQVKEFDVAHEKLMHLVVVNKDLSFFLHLHPALQPDGSFLLNDFSFPFGGEYQLFADVAPKGAGGQVLLAAIKVEGKPKPAEPAPTFAEKPAAKVIAGVRVAFMDGATLIPKKTTPFTLSLRKAETGEPITDLEPYLGALGHMVMIHEDAQTFVHAHPDERDAENGKHGDLTFLTRPPKPGRYRMWVEFQRGGKVNRVEFSVEVKESGNASNTH